MSAIAKAYINTSLKRREIKKTSNSVSGLYPFKNGDIIAFESYLEKDFLIRHETYDSIAEIISQPFTIEYNRHGKLRHYTPDFLIRYKNYPWPFQAPEIVEVKPNKYITEQLQTQKYKYQAIFQHCKEQGYVFHFADENRIRDQRWVNAKFLHRFKKSQYEEEMSQWILKTVELMGSVSFDHLLSKHFIGKYRQATGINHIWSLVATDRLHCDLSAPLNHFTELWLPTYHD